MSNKEMTVIFFGRNHLRDDWKVDVDGEAFGRFFERMETELASYGVQLSRAENRSVTIDVKSYADLLNSVRVSSPADGIVSRCVGHIIGKSQNLDLAEDIMRAVKRVAFAPETIEPEEHNRRVCHNCGCGC